MGAFETDYAHGGIDPSQISLVVTKSDDDGDVTTAVEKVLTDAQKKAIDATVAWMGKMSKGPGAPTDAIGSVKSILSKLKAQPAQKETQKNTGGEVVSDVTKNKGGEVADVIKARHAYEMATAKAAGDDATESIEDVTKRHTAELEKASFGPSGIKPGEKDPKHGKQTATAKAAGDGEGEGDDAGSGDDDEVGNAVVIKSDGSVHVSGDAVNVNKAKGFTASRTQALKGAVAGLVKLLGDVDSKQLKEALAGLSDGRFPDLPIKPGFESATRPTAPVKKSEDGDDNGANVIAEALKEALVPIQKRLEDIENTRNPSKSVDGEGGSDNNTEVKKSLWDGVL